MGRSAVERAGVREGLLFSISGQGKPCSKVNIWLKTCTREGAKEKPYEHWRWQTGVKRTWDESTLGVFNSSKEASVAGAAWVGGRVIGNEVPAVMGPRHYGFISHLYPGSHIIPSNNVSVSTFPRAETNLESCFNPHPRYLSTVTI